VVSAFLASTFPIQLPTSQPNATTTSPSSTFQRPTWEDNVSGYNVPLVLSNLEDLDQMGIAYALFMRAIVEGEAKVVEQQYHQQILIMRAFAHQDTPWALQLVVTYCFKCCD